MGPWATANYCWAGIKSLRGTLAVHNNAIRTALAIAVPAAAALLDQELEKMNSILILINRCVDLQGTGETREQTEAEMQEMRRLEAELTTVWDGAASIEYLLTFERRVNPDIFFENLVEDCKSSLLTLQNQIKSAANKERKAGVSELAGLKKSGNYDVNVGRINHLESLLNDASERYVSGRLGNYIKTELLNAKKMTPKFLKIAEVSIFLRYVMFSCAICHVSDIKI